MPDAQRSFDNLHRQAEELIVRQSDEPASQLAEQKDTTDQL
jgi:hypothetical protein